MTREQAVLLLVTGFLLGFGLGFMSGATTKQGRCASAQAACLIEAEFQRINDVCAQVRHECAEDFDQWVRGLRPLPGDYDGE